MHKYLSSMCFNLIPLIFESFINKASIFFWSSIMSLKFKFLILLKVLIQPSIKFVGIVYFPSDAIKCTNPNANQNTAAKVLFKYNMVNGKGYIIKLGASGNLYYYGLAESSNYVFFRKVTPIDTTIWEKIYQFKPNVYAFDLDSAETYMYSVASVGTSLNIVQVATADGSISKQVQTTSFQDSAYTSVSVSSDSSTVYISGF